MTSSSPTLSLRVSPRAAVYEVEDRLYLRLDAEGRWAAFAEGNLRLRRALDGRVLRPRASGFEALDDEAAALVHAWVGRRAGELLELLAAPSAAVSVVQGTTAQALARLAAAACWSRARLAGERDRFHAAYPETVPVLPPHRYRDLVVLPATGCPNHRCTFCALYRDRPFRALDDEAFARHLDAVALLLGAALGERDGVFFGSASALSLPDDVLLRRLAATRERLGSLPRGVAAFLDPDLGRPRAGGAWRRLGAAGLVDAALGLETGEADLRCRLGKSGDLSRLARTVAALAEGGVGVTLTVLLGIGPDEDAERRHRDATIAFLAQLPLGEGDRIYLSPLLGAPPPRPDAATWRAALRAATKARVGEYRLDRFAWLT